MEKSESTTTELSMRLSLLKVELEKKKLKLEKQKRYASSRKKRLELAKSSNKNGTEKTLRSRKSCKNVKFNNDVTSIPEMTNSQLCVENIDNSEVFETQKQLECLSVENKNTCESRVRDIDFTSGCLVLMNSESIDDESKTSTDQNKQFNSFEKIVSKDVGLCVLDERNEISLQSNIDIHEDDKYQKLFVQVNNLSTNDVFNTDFNYRPRDSQSMKHNFKIDLQIKMITLLSENGIVLFCDYFDETLVVLQQNVLSLYSTGVDGNWFVVHKYIRKSNWRFCDGYFNTKDNIIIELNENHEHSGFVEFFLMVYKTKECWQEWKIVLYTLSTVPWMMTHCFLNQHVAVCYQLQADSLSYILTLDIKKTKANVIAEIKHRITYVHFLSIFSEVFLLVCCDIGECFLYKLCGVLLQSYKLSLLADPCLFVALEKNILFLITGNKLEKYLVLAALNLLTKQHRVLQKYQFTSAESVADLLVFIKGRQLIALNKVSFTSWDIKTGVQSTTWSLIDPGSVFFQKDFIFVVNSKQDNLSLLTVS